MSTQLASVPLGSNANLTVTESAGALTIAVADPSLGLTNSTTINAVTLINAWAAASSNAEFAALLKEAATLLQALPA